MPSSPEANEDPLSSMQETDAEPEADPREELRRLAATFRGHLQWLQASGLLGVPWPARSTEPVGPLPASRPLPGVADRPVMTGRPEPASASRPSLTPAPAFSASPPPAFSPSPPRAAPAPPVPQVQQARTYAELPDPLPAFGQDGLDLTRRVLGDCQRCKLCHGRTELVFGQGAAEARLVFVGEGPGAEEDRTGLPFVGAAGDLLTRMIAAMGLRREQVYICNVVKCRPPGNRTPDPDEIAACQPFLRAQIQAIRPKIIVALGRTPTQVLLKTSAPIGRLRGQFSSFEGIPVMPTFHPAYLLRTPSAKRQVWDDLQLVMAELKKLDASSAAGPA